MPLEADDADAIESNPPVRAPRPVPSRTLGGVPAAWLNRDPFCQGFLLGVVTSLVGVIAVILGDSKC